MPQRASISKPFAAMAAPHEALAMESDIEGAVQVPRPSIRKFTLARAIAAIVCAAVLVATGSSRMHAQHPLSSIGAGSLVGFSSHEHKHKHVSQECVEATQKLEKEAEKKGNAHEKVGHHLKCGQDQMVCKVTANTGHTTYKSSKCFPEHKCEVEDIKQELEASLAEQKGTTSELEHFSCGNHAGEKHHNKTEHNLRHHNTTEHNLRHHNKTEHNLRHHNKTEHNLRFLIDGESEDIAVEDALIEAGAKPKAAANAGLVLQKLSEAAPAPEVETADDSAQQNTQSTGVASDSASSTQSPLAPKEHMHDGNLCDSNEEEYGGLCYKKCSILTFDQAPMRTSSWTCCGEVCTVENERGNLGSAIMCSGFDINGVGGCPHAPGVCLSNEELHLGTCFKKCKLVTNGEFPYRIGAATCCRAEGMGCLDIMNDETRPEFDVGGGAGDGDAETPGWPHPPDVHLAEADAAPIAPGISLLPTENRTDGNVCDDEEELYASLCYKKCSLLTNGEAPIRTSSWTCGQQGRIGSAMLCDGFDICGEGSCPHPPGVCLVDEEFSLGVCYKKCSLLTNGLFNYRYTAATCCKVEGWGCLSPSNLRTSALFDVGGGGGDHNPETLSGPHPPQQSLAEG